MILSVRVAICFFLLVFLSSCLFKPRPFDEDKWKQTVESTRAVDLYAENHRDGEFFNPWLVQSDKSFFTFLRWRLSSSKSYSEDAYRNIPTVQTGLLERIHRLNEKTDFLVWIGHATFLLRLGGEYWLTDPILTQRALLPKRLSNPGLSLEDLEAFQGKLHVVLSHNHYDHLDVPTLESMPPGTTFYVPEGLEDYVSSFTDGTVHEMNWWESLRIPNGGKLTCLPAQHWSRRIFQGYNTTLWASYLIDVGDTSIYFGGDSGYFKGYKEIGQKYPAIDYALLPITAYDPRWFMHYAHMDTTEAVQAFQDLKASYFIPTQWGTFHLGDNPPGLPPLDLQEDIEKLRLDPARYLILDIGEILTIQ